MGREQDVKVRGVVLRQMTERTGFNEATYLVEVPEQDGEHLSGTRHRVCDREVVARPSAKMSASGIAELREGDEVFLLVNPNGNRHVNVMIRLARQARDARRSGSTGAAR